MTDQYLINEQIRRDGIAGSRRAIPELLSAGNFGWAAKNYAMMADGNTELGLLHWRRSLDPRSDFESAGDAYDKLRAIVQERGLEKRNHEFPVVYAMLFLIGRQMPIEFEDELYHEVHRWPCYQSCLIHALHDQPLNDRDTALINRYLAENDELADQIFLTYLQLLGTRPTDHSIDELVTIAEANWLERKSDKFFRDGPAFDGYGVMNELYVDIYLAGVLKKINWTGNSIHRWIWG